MVVLHPTCLVGGELWRARVPLISFNVVAMHPVDRVMIQFGLRQHIPDPMEMIRAWDERTSVREWREYETYVRRWREREDAVYMEHPMPGTFARTREVYMQWYTSRTHVYTQQRPSSIPVMSYQPRGPVERDLVRSLN